MVSVAAPVATIKWVKPAPIWDPQDPDMLKPFLAEFDGDRFLPDFLDLMGGKVPDKTPANLSDHAVALTPDGKRKLYQPLHGNYYLVTGSLVCRQFGLPDRTVARKNGEKVSFVVRRLMPLPLVLGQAQQYVEQAWVKDDKSWHPLLDDQSNPVPLLKNEERLPTHPVKVCVSTQLATGTKPVACDQRTVYHGYIPVDSREKYLAPAQQKDLQESIKAITDNGGDLRLEEIQTRVIEVWYRLFKEVDTTASPLSEKPIPPVRVAQGNTLHTLSLYLILDLADCLNKYLPDVFSALTQTGQPPPTIASHKLLFDEFSKITVPTTNPPGTIGLDQAINELQSLLSLVQGQGTEPIKTYDMLDATLPAAVDAYLGPGGTLETLFSNAFASGGTPPQPPSEVSGIIKIEPLNDDLYCLRLVYEHDPCDPVISDRSEPFYLAKVFDPDAPARHIRIELPSIKMKDLRKFKRGIGFQMPSDLNDLINRVNPGMLQGGGLLDQGTSVGLAFICSFSIPIITICAFIVMFIFLILLNFIFWWLPFIRICFPIPKRK